MQLIWNELMTFSLILLISMGLAAWLSKTIWYQKFKANYLEQPARCVLNVSNKREMDQVIKLIPKLTMEEREHLACLLFGRSIKLQKTITPAGQSWFDLIAAGNDYEELEDGERREVG